MNSNSVFFLTEGYMMGLVTSVKSISNKAIKYLYHVGFTDSLKSYLEYLLKEHF